MNDIKTTKEIYTRHNDGAPSEIEKKLKHFDSLKFEKDFNINQFVELRKGYKKWLWDKERDKEWISTDNVVSTLKCIIDSYENDNNKEDVKAWVNEIITDLSKKIENPVQEAISFAKKIKYSLLEEKYIEDYIKALQSSDDEK